jgi:histidinol-phosphate aminotransferase
MDFEKFILPHIWNLKPYSSARDEFKGNEGVFLDANENPFGSSTPTAWNRYPDPLQLEIKSKIAQLKNCQVEQLFLGNGSDEAIDLIIRMTCLSGVHNLIICPPTYGMYEVSANINHISIRQVPLTKQFDLNVDGILQAIDESTRLIFICSPNNPTGNKLNRADIYQVLESFNTGFVIIDEAYIDFSDEPSFIHELDKYPQLIVLQTLSKAYGLASLRLGMAIAHPTVISLLNKVKPPYNISGATQEQVRLALSNQDFVKNSIEEISIQKNSLILNLNEIKEVEEIFPSHANFILVKFKASKRLFDYLIEHKVITRNRSNVTLCEGCIRITIGKKEENEQLISQIKAFYQNTNV